MRTRMLVFSGTLVLALLLVAGTSQAAAQRPPLDPAKCPKGFSTEFPTTKSMLLTATTTKQDAESFLDTSLYCPNACFDLSATLTLTYSGLRVVVSGSNRCNSNSMAPNDPAQTPTPRGCNAGEQQPQIVIVTKDVYSSFKGFRIKDQTVNKSRCDHNVIDAAVGKFASGLVKAAGGDPTGGEAQMQSALNDIRTKSDSNPLTGAPVPESAGSEALAEALRGLGIPAPQAGEIAKNSQSASDLIKAYQSGDPETIKAALQKAAKVANVSINDEVFNNVARLT
ncbi:MAG: hypothetical protein Q8P19_01585, partial [bacterium]|nr:hypothetical protein [bacterium]